MATSALRVLPGLALACLLAAVLAPGSRAGGDGEAEEAQAAASAHLFGKQCAACHSVPDPALATGRAWIDQVHRTA